MATGGWETVIAAMGELPADAAQTSDATLADRMQELVRLRAMVDAAFVEQLSVFDARRLPPSQPPTAMADACHLVNSGLSAGRWSR
jgi:hypothetical protein